MSVTGFDLPPPSSWQAFEALCHDLFTSDWNASNANRIGRNGQKQFGVDIVARIGDEWAGIQCKLSGRGSELKPADLADIVSEALEFEPPLDRFVIATTTPNDEPLQREARRLDEAYRNQGGFGVEIVGWGDILAMLDRHPPVVRRHYAALARLGVESGPVTDFQNRIDRFARQYLGRETAPAPFVGRTKELAELDQWREAPDSPYKLLRAAAGRGKSGLIVNWIASLENAAAVVHMPISARYRTNLAQVVLVSILSRLSALHGRPLPEWIDIDVEQAKGLIADLLARPLPGEVPLLLIIDGLDEAADFEVTADIFPSEPPLGLKVLLAGRPVASDDPLALLGAPSSDLGLLSRSEVYEGLRAFGVDATLAERITTLVDGDPVVLRLYLDGVTEASVSLAALSDVTPGLDGFIKRWWADQKALWSGLDASTLSLVESLTCVLSCALGPLSRSDLANPRLSPNGVSLLQLDTALACLSRLIVGEGKVNDIAFAHPRLADFFREEWMPPRRRAEFERRFIDWGEGELSSLEAENQRISPHLVSHLGAYLERAAVGHLRLKALTTRAWADQCYALDPSLSGFLTDVSRCRKAASAVFQSTGEGGGLASLAHCALTTATVRTIANGLDQNVLTAALRLRIWSAEIVFSQLATVRNLRLDPKLLAEVAAALGEERASEVLSLAFASEKRQGRLEITGALLPVLPPKERDAAVEAMVEGGKAQGRWLRLHDTPLEIGLEIVARATDPVGRVYGLATLLPAMPQSMRPDVEAKIEVTFLAHIDEFREDFSYSGAFENLSLDRRLRLLRRLFEVREEDTWKLAAMREIAWAADEDLAAELLLAARSISEGRRGEALVLLAPSIPACLIDEFLDAVDEVGGWEVAASLGALARRHSGPWIHRALDLCRQGDMHPSIRAPILVDLCRELDDDERLAIEPMLLADLNAPVDSRAWDEHDPNWLLGDFAETFLHSRPVEALRLLREIDDDDVVAALAANFAVSGPDEIRQAAMSILDAVEDGYALVEGYAALISQSTGTERQNKLRDLCLLATERGFDSILISAAVVRGWDLDTQALRAIVTNALIPRRVQDWHELGDAAAELGRQASSGASADAMKLMGRIGFEIPLARVASAFANKFNSDQQQRIIDALKKHPDAFWAASLLEEVCPYFSDAMKADVGAWANALPEEGDLQVEAKARFIDVCLSTEDAIFSNLEMEWKRLFELLPKTERGAARRSVRRSTVGAPADTWRRAAVEEEKAKAWASSDLVENLLKEDRHDFYAEVWLERLIGLGHLEKRAVLIDVLSDAGARERKAALTIIGRLAPVLRDIGGFHAVDDVVSDLRGNVESWG